MPTWANERVMAAKREAVCYLCEGEVLTAGVSDEGEHGAETKIQAMLA